MVSRDFEHILTAARQLSKPAQAQLVSALLHEPGSVHTPVLEPVTGLSAAELRAVAASVFAPAHARRLTQLLRINREKTLPHAWQEDLDALLAESDRMALVKAKANYTLSLLKA